MPTLCTLQPATETSPGLSWSLSSPGLSGVCLLRPRKNSRCFFLREEIHHRYPSHGYHRATVSPSHESRAIVANISHIYPLRPTHLGRECTLGSSSLRPEGYETRAYARTLLLSFFFFMQGAFGTRSFSLLASSFCEITSSQKEVETFSIQASCSCCGG